MTFAMLAFLKCWSIESLNHCVFVQVTKTPDDHDGLMRRAVEAAAQYNLQCAEIRKKNRENCVDTHSKVSSW